MPESVVVQIAIVAPFAVTAIGLVVRSFIRGERMNDTTEDAAGGWFG